MSCGEGHEVPCDEVLQDVYLYLDSECDLVAKQKIRQHLTDCDTCLREFGIEKEVKALVARCCEEGPPPEGLKDRLRAKLALNHPDGAH